MFWSGGIRPIRHGPVPLGGSVKVSSRSKNTAAKADGSSAWYHPGPPAPSSPYGVPAWGADTDREAYRRIRWVPVCSAAGQYRELHRSHGAARRGCAPPFPAEGLRPVHHRTTARLIHHRLAWRRQPLCHATAGAVVAGGSRSGCPPGPSAFCWRTLRALHANYDRPSRCPSSGRMQQLASAFRAVPRPAAGFERPHLPAAREIRPELRLAGTASAAIAFLAPPPEDGAWYAAATRPTRCAAAGFGPRRSTRSTPGTPRPATCRDPPTKCSTACALRLLR